MYEDVPVSAEALRENIIDEALMGHGAGAEPALDVSFVT
jgi:hypothetical protein